MNDIERQHEDLRSRGGPTVGGDHHDRRVTRAIDWFLAAIGGAILLWIARVDSTMTDIKINVATIGERQNSKDKRDDLQDRRLDTLEGRTFRGVDGYGKEEPGRGK